MRDALLNLLHLEPQNEVLEMYLVAVGAWLVVVSMAIWSICSRRISRVAKVAWTLAVTLVPLVGMLGYAIYSFFKADHGPFLGFMALRHGGGTGRHTQARSPQSGASLPPPTLEENERATVRRRIQDQDAKMTVVESV